jgi:hypothetical protein
MPNGFAEYPIPTELCAAFDRAVAAFCNWDYGLPEPDISYGSKPCGVGVICECMRPFSDPAPDYIYILVCKLAEDFRRGPEGFGHPCPEPKDHSYANVARCLQEFYIARKHYYRRKDAVER